MKRLLFSLLLCLVNFLPSSAQIYQWADRVGISLEQEWLYGMVADEAGNTISIGTFSSTVDFNPGPATFNLIGSPNYQSTFILKLDAAGNFVWAKAIVSSMNIKAFSIARDPNGSIFICGTYLGTADFDPGPGYHSETASSNTEMFVLKLDASGNFLWVRSIFSPWDDDYSYALTADNAGNVYMTGRQSNTTDYDFGTGTSILNGMNNLFVLKLNAAGNYVWVKGFGTDGIKDIFGIKANDNGVLCLTGHYNVSFDTDPGPGTNMITAAGPTSDAFVIALDTAGNHLWGKRIGAAGAHDVGQAVAFDPSGNVLITGFFGSSNLDFDPGSGTALESTAGQEDIFVLKLDVAGNYVWHARMGGTGPDKGNTIIVDRLGNVFTAGQFSSTVDFDPGAGTHSWTAAGYTDAFVQILDSNRTYKDSYRWGGNVDDRVYGLAVPSYNSIFSAGIFDNTVDFDPGAGVANLTSAGYYDVFVSKINQCISSSSTQQVSTCNSYTAPNGQTYTASGTYTTIIPSSLNCDSIITLQLTIHVPPSQPGIISGNSAICVGTSNSYMVAPVSGATSYTWTLPGGWTGSSTTNTISTVAGATGGTISVTANDSCGASIARTLSVAVNSIPLQPGAISGNTSVCQGFTEIYAVPSDPNVSSYTWTLPSGWAGSSTSNGIAATAASNPGTISVIASNYCGTSAPQTLAVTTVAPPAQPGAITGNNVVCAGTVNSYTVPTVPGAASYTWTLPSGWSGTSATNSINAIPNANAASGSITVTANDSCGASIPQTINVTIGPDPFALFTFTSNLLFVTFVDVTPAATDWHWDFGDGSTATIQNPTHTYASPGIYNVCLIAGLNGCTDTLCRQVNLLSNGIEDSLGVGAVLLFPNPSSGVFQLETDRKLNGQIVDAQGRIVMTRSLKAGNNPLDLSAYADGIYFLRLTNPVSSGQHSVSARGLRLSKIGN